MNHRSCYVLFSLFLITILPITIAQAIPPFEPAEGAIAEADSIDAAVLSPKMFGKAKEALAEGQQ